MMEDYEAKINRGESVTFAELAECHQRISSETDLEFLDRINDPTKWLYGSELRDEVLLKSSSMLSRYGHLARKALIHCAGEQYNPHTIDGFNEYQLRYFIKGMIEYKVFGRLKDYDWEIVDNFLRKTIGNMLNINIPYNQARLDEGIRPEFQSRYTDNDTITT